MYSQFYHITYYLFCNYREQLCIHKIMVPRGLQWHEMYTHPVVMTDIQVAVLFGNIVSI